MERAVFCVESSRFLRESSRPALGAKKIFNRLKHHPSHLDLKAIMNATVETLPNCLATLRVEVGPDATKQAREKVLSGYLTQARIPGFRPGKTPKALVEKRFSKDIAEQTESDLISESLNSAIREKGLRVLRVSNVEDVKMAPDGLSFSATIVTVPEFEMPDYKGVPVNVPVVTEAKKEQAIDTVIDDLRARQADFVDLVEDRGAAMEDFLVVDYTGTIAGQPVHESFPKVGQILSANEGFWIRMTEEAFFPGFCGHLLGAKAGDVREFQIEVPADFPVEGFGGQKIDYVVTVKEIKLRVLPELNDEFAASLAPGKSLAEVRELVRAEVARRSEAELETTKRDQVMEHLLSKVECELPEDMARAESSQVLSEVVEENQRRGVSQEMLRENEKELVASASQTARNRLKGSFILSRIAELENLQPTREEVLGRIAGIAKRAEMSVEKAIKEVSKRRMLPQIETDIITSKALDFVLSHAVVTEVAEG
jgi:trigger factor